MKLRVNLLLLAIVLLETVVKGQSAKSESKFKDVGYY